MLTAVSPVVRSASRGVLQIITVLISNVNIVTMVQREINDLLTSQQQNWAGSPPDPEFSTLHHCASLFHSHTLSEAGFHCKPHACFGDQNEEIDETGLSSYWFLFIL